MIPLPKKVRDLVSANTHPGLALDKYVDSWHPGTDEAGLSESVQRPTIRKVVELNNSPGRNIDDFRKAYDYFLNAGKAMRFKVTTSGPLTSHLSRASALENAGLCLHPIYGFAYLPGTGLKGLARSYAVTVAKADSDVIRRVFGGDPGKAPFDCGGVVFHDAWPTTWPRLEEDILNSHHKDYYGKPESQVPPPGDWEEPNMVSFLAVSAGVTFECPLAKRRDDFPDALLEQAREWLLGGLTTLGFGAKTAAGYGHFQPVLGSEDVVVAKEGIEEFTLELATPAFLAGPDQADPKGCRLRPSTLRGMLRWWWRTMHAGHVSPADLRRLEAAVWGNTKIGGAARFTIEAAPNNQAPLSFDRKAIIARNKLPAPPNKKTAQGLTYHSYGMDEAKGRRSYLAPGAKWTLGLQVRGSMLPLVGEEDKAKWPKLSPKLVAEQATAALWLLCRYGGTGSKARKGFGSFAVPAGLASVTDDKCREIAASFRAACGLKSKGVCESPTLDGRLPVLDVSSLLKNYWLVSDLVGMSVQAFAQALKHDLSKKALGLPRKIGVPTKGKFKAGVGVKERHASPIHIRLWKSADGTYSVTVTAFPAHRLPTPADSTTMLQKLLEHLKVDLPKRFADYPHLDSNAWNPSPVGSSSSGIGVAPPVPKLPKVGDLVDAILLEEKSKKGGWKAKLATADVSGPIQNSSDVPVDKSAGDVVRLVIAISSPNIAFRWPK